MTAPGAAEHPTEAQCWDEFWDVIALARAEVNLRAQSGQPATGVRFVVPGSLMRGHSSGTRVRSYGASSSRCVQRSRLPRS